MAAPIRLTVPGTLHFRPLAVRVVAEAIAERAVADRDATAPLILTLSANPGHREHCLGLPLRADELEAELNRLGASRVSARSLARPVSCGGEFGP